MSNKNNCLEKSCEKCSNKFIAYRPNFKVCPTCYKMDSPSNICFICQKKFLSRPIPKYYKNKVNVENTCPSCWSKEELKYRCCDRTYHGYSQNTSPKWCEYCSKCSICDKFLGRETWNYYPKCNNCLEIQKYLSNNKNNKNNNFGNTNQNLARAGYKVKVNYQVHEEKHSGYCSDPGECESNEYEEEIEFPCLIQVKNEDLDRNGNIVGEAKKYYQKSDVGHGYCGMKTTYEIKKIKVIEDKKLIKFSD